MKTYSFALVAGLGIMATMASCVKEASVPSYEEAQKESYASSFVAKYGQIRPNQTWDFTTGERNLATRGYSAINVEVLENGVDWGDVSNLELKHTAFPQKPVWDYDIIMSGIQKNTAIFNAINIALPEKKGQKKDEVVLVAPSSSFYIYPLLSGGGNRYDLMVKVGNEEPVCVFKKDYTNFQTVNGMKKLNGETVNMRGVKVEAPVGTPVEIYLDNMLDVDNKPLPTMGTTNGYAVYIDVPNDAKLELDDVELAEDHVVKYIGIEDAANGDFDYNDLVLAVVGNPDVPQEKIITENQYEVTTCRAKRYMIEDLGAIGDFDFNDVVVDVEEYTVYTHKVTSENGVKTSDEIISTTTAPTKAFIRALGGTIDFELTIGDTKWVKSESDYATGTMYNTQGTIDYKNALAEFEVTGYNYDDNNITFRANGKDGKLYTVTFPKRGEAPMMIAVDPTVNWMNERVSIPSSWFTE
jgi:hypothetical protein